MPAAPQAAYGSLPFAEQIAFFRAKINLPTAHWTDISKAEHDFAFVVAGANRNAIVQDFRVAVEQAIAQGTTLEQFRKDFDAIVARHGWDYNGGRDWRSRVIYETNLNTSYAAGRFEQLQAAPFWQYQHADWVTHPRQQHQAWDGLVLAREDAFWHTHFPPNGWGCHCSVRGLWARDLKRLGKEAPDKAPEIRLVEREIGQRSPNGPRRVTVPEGIDPGFDYAPGRARLQSAIPPERPEPLMPGSAGGQGLPNRRPLEPLPPPRPISPEKLLPAGLPPEEYVRAFLAPLGGELARSTIVPDVIGERLVVGKELFQTAKGEWKVLKLGREQFLPLLAQALLQPDEIWVRMEWMYALSKAVVRRRYVARFSVAGQEVPTLVVFEYGEGGWSGITAFQGAAQTADDWRVGVRLYARE